MSNLNENAPNPNEKFIFKCDGHAATAFEELLSFYQENKFFDTILIAGTDRTEIQAHKVVLCALSKYFSGIFHTNFEAAKANNVVELKEIEPTTLKSIIDFMYSGCIELSLETAEGFLRAAAFLKIITLIDGCNSFIEKQLTLNNCLHWYRLAQELSLPGLKDKSLAFTYTHFEMVSKEKELLLVNEKDLQDLLFNDNPYGDFEEDIFRTLIAWIAYDKMLSMVRYQYLTPKFIIENRKSVCKNVETYELICSWLQWHLSPETRSVDQQNGGLKPRNKEDKLAVIYVTDAKQNYVGIKTFDPKVNAWSLIKEMPLVDKKTCYSMVIVDEKLIVVGGYISKEPTNRVECLDLQTCMWTDMPPMLTKASNRQVESSNEYLCVLHSDFNMEIYSFSKCKWYEVEHPSTQIGSCSRIVFHNGIVHVLDFYNGHLQSYDIASNQWTLKAIKKQQLEFFSLAAIGRFLYVIGGYCHASQSLLKRVMRYDLSNDSWCLVAPSQISNCFLTPMKTLVLKNKIVISNGKSVEEYNPNTNTWKTLCAAPECPSQYLLCSLPSKLL